MPLHLDSIMNNPSSEVLTAIVQNELDQIDDAWVEKSKVHFLGSRRIFDAQSQKQIGKYVFTFFTNKEESINEVIDLDIVLNCETPVELEFLDKHSKSSDSNEYYEVQTVETEQHLCIETVNRYLIPTDLLNTKQNVYCSAFPFSLTVFDDVGASMSFSALAATA